MAPWTTGELLLGSEEVAMLDARTRAARIRGAHGRDVAPASRLTPGTGRVMWGLVVAVLLLNLVDALATLTWIELGTAAEANPLMATLLDAGPVPFVLGKVVLVSLGVALLWRTRHRSLSLVGVFVLFTAYYAVVVQHLFAVGEMLAFGPPAWLG